MKLRLLDIVRCPACKGAFELHVIRESRRPLPREARGDPRVRDGGDHEREVGEGWLRCVGCGLLYPVIDGVPRLIRNAFDEYRGFFAKHRERVAGIAGVDEVAAKLGTLDASVFDARSAESFGLQWAKYQDEDRTWYKDDAGLRREEFLSQIDLPAGALRGRLVLDAGCGNGKLTATIATHGAEVVGMDFSRSVERAAGRAASVAGDDAPFVHFVQGNILEPPFAAESFDHIHSSGVLHHTPDTWRAFASFLALGKPGAHVYVQLYRVREAWVRVPNAVARAVTSRLPPRVTWAVAWRLVPLHTALVRGVARLRGEETPITKANRRERAVSLFDHLSPRYQYRYRPHEVRERFEAAGLESVKEVTLANEARHMVAFVGRRPVVSEVAGAA
jgi:SAM-dependent methyltransferase/uncharacterized protein YbaR (Trm112 family)